MISVHQMGEVLGIVVAPAPNLQNFILQKQVLASGDVASGLSSKTGSQ